MVFWLIRTLAVFLVLPYAMIVLFEPVHNATAVQDSTNSATSHSIDYQNIMILRKRYYILGMPLA